MNKAGQVGVSMGEGESGWVDETGWVSACGYGWGALRVGVGVSFTSLTFTHPPSHPRPPTLMSKGQGRIRGRSGP
jgi:hypothetical protein